jgi:peroxiredoxin
MKAMPIRYILLLGVLLLGNAATLATPGIAPSVDELAPLSTGDLAPAIQALKADGSEFTVDPATLNRPLLVVFYRGGWCGACNQQLRDLSLVMPEIRRLGVDALFPNGDRPDILYSSLAPETQLAIDGLDFLLLSDADLEAASAFGVAYVLDVDTLARYRARTDWDLEDSSIDRHDALPLPSVFLVGTDGRILFRYYNPDPRVRLPADELLRVLGREVTTTP